MDTCSTCNVSNNLKLVTNVRKCDPQDALVALTNGGSQNYSHEADLKILPIRVHFKPDSMGTILSFKTVCEIPGAHVTFDSKASTDIILQLQGGSKYIFKQFQNGLYYYDTINVNHNQYSKAELTDYIQLQTVKSNKQYFTTSKLKGADASRKYQEYLFYPGTKTFKHYVRNNLINNCSITVDDVNRAELIYGPPVPYLEGTMTPFRVFKVPYKRRAYETYTCRMKKCRTRIRIQSTCKEKYVCRPKKIKDVKIMD